MKSSPLILKKNLTKLGKSQKKLAYQISYQDALDLQFCYTEQGELNLKRDYQGQEYFYHSPVHASKEAQEWFEALDLQGKTTLFVYGIGLGYYYEAAKQWLKSKRIHRLVFLEQDLSVLHRLMETERGTELLKHPQIELVYFDDLVTNKETFNEISWTYISSPFVVASLKLYEQENSTGFLELCHHLAHEVVQKRALVDEYLQYGIVFFRNFYPNLLELPQAYLGNALFGQFKNTPAIICGAGPSLSHQFEQLQALSQQAVLFAGGSALNALIPQKIIPHFGVAIDPNQAQCKRIAITEGKNIPFFYRNRLFHEALKLLSGPRLYLTGTGGYEIATWFENQLGIVGDCLDEGHNVVNFCIEIAQALGCNPIILVGVDLALTNQQHYANGIIENLQLTEEDFKTDTDLDSQPLLKQDIYDQPTFTYWKWITEAEWIAEFAENHPDTTLINATEGGIGFRGIPNLSLAEVADKYLKVETDFSARIHQEITKHALSEITAQKIKELMLTLKDSLERCIAHFSQLMHEMDVFLQQLKKEMDIPDALETPTTILVEAEIEAEVGYTYVLEVFNVIYMRVHHREIQKLQGVINKQSSKTKKRKKIQLHLQRLEFLTRVAQVNMELILRALNK